MCHVSGAMDPPTANSPTIHSRFVCKMPLPPKKMFLRPLCFYPFYVRNLSVINQFVQGLL